MGCKLHFPMSLSMCVCVWQLSVLSRIFLSFLFSVLFSETGPPSGCSLCVHRKHGTNCLSELVSGAGMRSSIHTEASAHKSQNPKGDHRSETKPHLYGCYVNRRCVRKGLQLFKYFPDIKRVCQHCWGLMLIVSYSRRLYLLFESITTTRFWDW